LPRLYGSAAVLSFYIARTCLFLSSQNAPAERIKYSEPNLTAPSAGLEGKGPQKSKQCKMRMTKPKKIIPYLPAKLVAVVERR
jgi:hypothetical protein